MIEPVRIPARARLNPERPDGGAPFRGELPGCQKGTTAEEFLGLRSGALPAENI